MLKLFAIKDAKSEAYGPIITYKTQGLFLREISEAIAQGQTVWAKHPQDFTLYELGEYDADTGDVHMYEEKKALGLVADFKTN